MRIQCGTSISKGGGIGRNFTLKAAFAGSTGT